MNVKNSTGIVQVVAMTVTALAVIHALADGYALTYVENPDTGAITNLAVKGDASGMNWVHVADRSQYAWIGPEYGWGTGTLKMDGRPVGWLKPGRIDGKLDVVRTRSLENGVLCERFVFRNVSERPVKLTEIDIHTPFNDNYPKPTSEMYKRRCHAHVWPGGAAGWVSAMRIGGRAPHLGLAVTRGGVTAYAQKERSIKKGFSNVRGVLSLSPPDVRLGPGESQEVEWKVFAHDGWEDFHSRLVALGGACVTAERYVARIGEHVKVSARTKDGVWSRDWTCPGAGDHRVDIDFGKEGGRRAWVEILGVGDPEKMLLARARYIVKHQQVLDRDSPYDGALVPYDTETGRQERKWEPGQSHLTVDHSEGGERMGMGVFLAKMAQRGYAQEFGPAIERYYRFCRNRLQDPDYTSWQEVKRPSRARAFNYPWFIRFYLELYRLTDDLKYLDDAYGTALRLFSGCVEVPDCLVEFPVRRLVEALRKAGLSSEADRALSLVLKYLEPSVAFDADNVTTHEVGIAPEMVAGVIEQLLDAYALTGETRYRLAAKRWMPLAEAVCGRQPTWHAHDIGLHHWDGFWFGKLQRWGDTLPHDWNGTMAGVFRKYAAVSGDPSYAKRAGGIADSMLGLFSPDGRATCAWIYTDRVNGVPAKGPDPLANDQDWALVYYLDDADRVSAPAEWEDLSVDSVNRLPPRTYSVPLADESAALTEELEPKTPYAVSLNGEWRFSWAGNPDLRVKDFWKSDFDDSDWMTIDVPSCVELRGFGSPVYTNIRYPHKNAWPHILDRQSGRRDYNPVSSYRRTFSVPGSWQGRRVVLRFEGVGSAYYVWVNGRRVGYAEDSKLPSEFDVTDDVVEGDNVLAVEAYRWCDGSYLEDQDMTRYSGIFRDVTLWSMPQDGIWDFSVRTSVDGHLEVKIVDESKSKSEVERRTEALLYDAEHKKVGDLHCSPSSSAFALDVKNVHTWSAEDPYLYTLVIRKGDDIRMKRVGFKDQRIVGNVMLVNGRKVKFKGVNRHETSPVNGRTVSLDEMVRDIVLMKRYNINTVRTSHYPDHRLWYDLCDRYGIYLCAEANVEAHEPGFGKDGLGRFPEWEHAIVERNERHVVACRNHPSVTLWSVGNETGHGDCFRKAIAAVRKLDPSRPIHWERGNTDADIDARMYTTVEWLESRGRAGDGLADISTVAPERGEDPANRQSGCKPFFMSEYAHAMGNAVGNLSEYWDVFNRYDSLTGGCIWDWVDQAVWKKTDRVDAQTGACECFYAFGGDFDEQPNDGPFNCNGLVNPERCVSPKLTEVGHVYRNLAVTRRSDGSFELWNRFAFTDADSFDGKWQLVVDGEVERQGTFRVPSVAPLSRGIIGDLPTFPVRTGHEVFVNFAFCLKNDCRWGERGWTIARDQVRLNACEPTRLRQAKPAKSSVIETDETITLAGDGTKAVFSRKTGTLCELSMGGVRVLKDVSVDAPTGPRMSCERAFVDNDRWLHGNPLKHGSVGSFFASGLSQLNHHVRSLRAKGGGVCIVVEVTGTKSAGFTYESQWRLDAAGVLVVDNRVVPHGVMPPAIPRLGLSWRLDAALENVRYYGRGPHENYVDRCSSAFFGTYGTTVTDLFEDYVRPQDNGYRCDVRWVELLDAKGRGVRFSASEPLYVQALHYSREDLEFARPWAGQSRFRVPLVPRNEVCLNLDVRQLGLGGGSCGPDPMRKYIFPIEETVWELRIEPILAREIK